MCGLVRRRIVGLCEYRSSVGVDDEGQRNFSTASRLRLLQNGLHSRACGYMFVFMKVVGKWDFKPCCL